ncbi:hypothetical protein [Cupriavidus sp. AcVe19-1a]|uniref:hypothetical protein n=1 Tax=Cupriavidus sp. AcVe19-1a TaxID=2821359 RepID=UPI001AE0FE1A|nr:hypothetical protein [Cupriavidus sp. AcVe19-1a]MBP0633072.1 hypothetical protein [Cupriavidus sp. AcVe19-1a]
MLSNFTKNQLLTIASALADAYPGYRASELLASIGENFDVLTDNSDDHLTRVQDAVADLTARGRLGHLLATALSDPQHRSNPSLHGRLQNFVPEARWQALSSSGHVMRLGPFVDRLNLRRAIKKLFVARRVLRVNGSTGMRGKSWSCQLMEREAELRGARYVKFDFREAPLEGRETPLWLATSLHCALGRDPQELAASAETRLLEPLLVKWLPPEDTVLVVLDHLGDSNVKDTVREYVLLFANAVAEGKLPGLRLVLIDGPPGLALSPEAMMHSEDDVIGVMTLDHVTEFFQDAARALFPQLQESERDALVAAAVTPLAPTLPGSASEALAIAIRDALEELAFL